MCPISRHWFCARTFRCGSVNSAADGGYLRRSFDPLSRPTTISCRRPAGGSYEHAPYCAALSRPLVSVECLPLLHADRNRPSTQAIAKTSLMSSVATLATTTYAISLNHAALHRYGVVDPIGDSVTVTTYRPGSRRPDHGRNADARRGQLGQDRSRVRRLPTWASTRTSAAARLVRLPAAPLPFDQSDLQRRVRPERRPRRGHLGTS